MQAVFCTWIKREFGSKEFSLQLEIFQITWSSLPRLNPIILLDMDRPLLPPVATFTCTVDLDPRNGTARCMMQRVCLCYMKYVKNNEHTAVSLIMPPRRMPVVAAVPAADVTGGPSSSNVAPVISKTGMLGDSASGEVVATSQGVKSS